MRAIDVKRIRTKVLGMTQRQLADALGISKRQIGRYESATVPVSDKAAAAIATLSAGKCLAKKRKSKW